MKKLYLFFLVFLLPSQSWAVELRSWKQAQDGSLTYVIMHSESGVYFVEQFFQPKGSLQDRTLSFSYSNKKVAHKKYTELSKGFHRTTPPVPEMEPSTQTDPGVIWPTRNQWNLDWEKRFEAWVKSDFHANFFLDHQISTDCADAAIALRWIFSRIHYLPAAQSLAGSGFIFSNEMMRDLWKDVPSHEDWKQDQRFRAGLDYVLKNTYTHSLMRDLYPIAIDRNSFHPGTILLNLYDEYTGHTEIISDLNLEEVSPEPIRILASDVPREIRKLNEYPLQDWGNFPTRGKSGFHRFRWPMRTPLGFRLQPEESMPYFSLEQFSEAFAKERPTLTETVIYRLYPDWDPDYASFLRSLVNLVIQRLEARVKIVEDGYQFCRRNDCSEGTAGWESWSTPSRDAAISRIVQRINKTYQDSSCDRSCRDVLLSQMGKTLFRLGNKNVTLKMALEIWANRKYSSDPRVSIEKRWGFSSTYSSTLIP